MKIVVGVSGASGSIYGLRLLEKLRTKLIAGGIIAIPMLLVLAQNDTGSAWCSHHSSSFFTAKDSPAITCCSVSLSRCCSF